MHKDKAIDIFAAVLAKPGIPMSELSALFREAIPHPTLHRKVGVLVANNLLAGTFESGQLVALEVPHVYAELVSALLSKNHA